MTATLPSSDENFPILWLLAFAVSLICLFAVGFEAYFGSSRRSLVLRTCIRCGVMLVGMMALAEILAGIPVMDGWELVARTAVLAVGAVGVALLIPWDGLAQDASRRVSWTVVTLTVLATIWVSARFYGVSSGESSDLSEFDVRSAEQCLEVVPHSLAYTDRGRAISLYQYTNPKDGSRPNVEEAIPDVFESKLILAREADPQANCHGWVFAGGKFVVRGAAVDNILDDNGYQQVAEPSVGDVVVHRDLQGVPLHSGIVKATGKDGFVLIESKWGSLGRYFHEPKTQCYSQSFAYYRSTRPDHNLRIEESAELECPGIYPIEPSPSRVLAKTRQGDADPKVLGAE